MISFLKIWEGAGTGVAILSLGESRFIRYRSRCKPKREFDYLLESGSLLYMSQEMQEDWLHGIPKQEEKGGERISVTFRKILK
jgi:alkylated DNA repair dioxygenase AlkB